MGMLYFIREMNLYHLDISLIACGTYGWYTLEEALINYAMAGGMLDEILEKIHR